MGGVRSVDIRNRRCQPWKFYVFTIPHTIHAFSTEIRTYLEGRSHVFGIDVVYDEDPVFYGAPVVIFLAAAQSRLANNVFFVV